MLKNRVIPCLLLQNGLLVRSELFSHHQVIGYPLSEAQRFSEWSVDELIYLDISQTEEYDLRRADHKVGTFTSQLEILDALSEQCFMPLTFGGRIRTVADMGVRFGRGADKITINTAAVDTPQVVTAGARAFGSQAIVVSMDVRVTAAGYEVFVDGGRRSTGLEPVAWAKRVESLGAGEILLTAVDRDGTGKGYDLVLTERVASAVKIPVIACGGVGRYEDFAPAILEAGASAVAAANIFHFKELSDRNAKRALARAGVSVRL